MCNGTLFILLEKSGLAPLALSSASGVSASEKAQSPTMTSLGMLIWRMNSRLFSVQVVMMREEGRKPLEGGCSLPLNCSRMGRS